MGRNNTKAVKNIAKMYEQLGLAQDDIFHKTKLLLSIYRDVVWATLADCYCVNEEIYYYGDDLTDALVYLKEFAPDVERSEFERRVCNLFENIPNTQPAIIDEDTWKRVQELREHRIRPTATGRTSLFSGKVFCADCGSKLHFCAAKSLNANQEHYRCSNYKSGRGSCQIHFIRNVVLEKIVLEAINSLADFVRCYEPVFLYLISNGAKGHCI